MLTFLKPAPAVAMVATVEVDREYRRQRRRMFIGIGVVNWIPTYLETAKGFSFQQSSLGWSLYE